MIHNGLLDSSVLPSQNCHIYNAYLTEINTSEIPIVTLLIINQTDIDRDGYAIAEGGVLRAIAKDELLIETATADWRNL